MIKQWIAAHRSFFATATSGSLVTALVVTVAVISNGYTAQRLDLNDASVWVSNGRQQVIGRANTEVLELNTVVASTGSDIEVVQQGSVVLLFDRGNNKVDIVDAANSVVTDTVPLPPDGPEVFLAGTNVVVLEEGTGQVWIHPAGDFANFDPEAEATLNFGENAIASVDPAGLLFAFSPDTRQLYRINAAVSDVADSTVEPDLETLDGDFSISSVGGRWAILDSAAAVLYLDGRSVDLTGLVQGTTAVLQSPSDSGDRVLVSHAGGVVSVPLSGAAAVGLTTGQFGVAVQPTAIEGCEYAAWSTGQAWRRCGADGSGVTMALGGVVGAPRMAFAANGDRLVLNDSRSGASWAVQSSGELINNWNDLITIENEEEQQEENDQDVPPEVDKVQQPPVAVEDLFGARPGKASVLPVLINDYDPNGDVLVIGEVGAIPEEVGRLDLINERQQVQLTLAEGATGEVRFGYTVTDGRGGSATANVVVTVRPDEQNSAPQQVRNTKSTVQSAGRVTTQVLGDWVDPDGDAFYLTSASVPAPDAVSHKPEGSVVFSDSGDGGDLKVVSLFVSDGSAEGSGSLSVTVKPAGEVPIIADPFVLLAYAGQELTVSPLDHVRGGTGIVRLNSVPSKTGVTVVPSYETGTFRFTSDQVRTHYLEYVVTDGDQTVTGLVRIDVASPPDPNTRPITIPKTVFVTTLSNQRVDVAGTDIDPAGGVLLVTGLMNLAPDSGVRAEVLEQRIVRVSLEAPLTNGPVSFNYRISNGLAEAEGVITVIEIAPVQLQPPVASDDAVTARVGQAINIPVLANDEHPDSAEFTLVPELAQELPSGSGLLFASGSELRFLAPKKTGNFTAVYQIEGPDGQRASASVRIAVRELDEATNNAPVPATVTARVMAGASVRIAIPLTGIDPDGDSVQLLGQATNPEKGLVQSDQTDSFIYQAGDYSAGTDTFTYTVIDALGTRATGTVRVGISPRVEGARNPVAILDEVTVRPGVTVSVEVLANDSDPDGSPLTVASVQPNDEVTTAEIVEDIVKITPPDAPGQYGVIYSIENGFGGTSQNFVRVTVDPEAPLAYPVARDTMLSLSDILERGTADVDVLANVFFADGDARDLGLSVYPGYGNVAQVTPTKRITVTMEDEGQIIPFVVTHPEDPSVSSYAFIWVPGRDDALPQVDRRAPPLRVTSEERLVIDLNDHVIAVGDNPVRITDSSTVRATHSNGDDLVVDAGTLAFTSADKYFGPASISFEVTDGTSADDPNGRKALLVLPIDVRPRENQPPVFDGAVIEFEPGEERELDLLRLTTYPYDDVDELEYTVLSPLPVGFTHELNGNVLTLRADETAERAATTAISLGVRDDLNEGRPGRIELTIVPSTRPLLQPGHDNAITKRGQTTTVDVLANDEATNPFPGSPLRVVAIRGLEGGALPAGMEIQPSADQSRLTVTVQPDAEPVDVNLQYQVADASGDPERYVWGSIRVSVQDRPDPVSNVLPTGFSDRIITMRWNAGAFNNSPITNYRVTTTTPSGDQIGTHDCPSTTCDIPTEGNGPANSVLVTVVAQNEMGDSDPVTLSSEVWSDIIPPAPGVVNSAALDHALRLSWNAVTTPNGGSAVDRYHVVVGGFSADVSPSVCGGGTCTWETPAEWALPNGEPVSFTISPRNGAYTALSVWNTSQPQSDIPAGPPISTGAPTASVVSDTAVRLDWPGIFDANGRAIFEYTAAAYTGGAPHCDQNGNISGNGADLIGTGSGTAAQFNGLVADTTYSLLVFAFNGQGCTASPAVIARTPPGVVTALTTAGPFANGEAYDFTVTGGSMGGTALTGEYSLFYRLIGVQSSEYGPASLGSFLTADGAQYGNDVGVQVRACRSYDSGAVCQPQWSGTFAVGTPVDPRVSGLTFTPDPDSNPAFRDGTFDWLGWPTGSYDAVSYRCSGQPADTWTAADRSNPGSCHADVGVGETPQLIIRVTENGATYDKVYSG